MSENANFEKAPHLLAQKRQNVEVVALSWEDLVVKVMDNAITMILVMIVNLIIVILVVIVISVIVLTVTATIIILVLKNM